MVNAKSKRQIVFIISPDVCLYIFLVAPFP
jgi:hypothetical protein